MDAPIITASAALIGSLVGGVSTFLASWATHREQLRVQTVRQEIQRREALYAEFIVEASRRLAEALAREAQTPEVIAGLYSSLERMRLTASDEITAAAHNVMREIVEVYAAPNRTLSEIREEIGEGPVRSPLTAFAEVCRAELKRLAGPTIEFAGAGGKIPA